MQRQRQCSNHLLAPVIWTQDVPKGTGPPRRRRKTPVERISPPTPPLLIRLMGNSLLLLSKLPPPTQKRTRITSKEVFSAEKADKDRVVAMTLLYWLSTPQLSRRRKKMSPKSSATTVTRRDIMLPSVPKDQKTCVSLNDLHAGNWD